jgi:uncharacterized protein (DUF302 family)
MAIDGLMAVVSKYGHKEGVDRVNAVISALGMTIVARIDHATAAANVSLRRSCNTRSYRCFPNPAQPW